ncbi:hypothetical protein NWP22_01740 [Anabaenopsis tanganyikae CS-531]|uniref:Uncharacterized protein n=1 Tax=Anabaenopsis tanganyikae CS-531 TaxID=2785304 RepID=A0ABT6KAZ0_9CYAN|nr:hypothetical protein [Anabaenopsis tanganyikae]MDH6104616.1 hypothetical protein [Anabaenopsis tanganyikae CS-531]
MKWRSLYSRVWRSPYSSASPGEDDQIHDLRVTQIPDFWTSYMR